MIILSQWQDFSIPTRIWLKLIAYSFQLRELESIPRVLRRSKIEERRIENTFKDDVGRTVWEFGLNSDEIERLEKSLNLQFLADRKGNVVIVPDFASSDRGGPLRFLRDRSGLWLPPDKERPYCCRELALHGDGDHNLQITANDDEDALFKCALLGGQRHWFGAKPSKGPCPRREH